MRAPRWKAIDLTDLNAERRPYDASQSYDDSKLADLVFALELQRRLTAAGSHVRSLAAHPGLSNTSLLDHSRSFPARMMSLVGQDVDQGALYAATWDLPGGSYVGPDGFREL